MQTHADFELHPGLESDSHPVAVLPLSVARLMDDARFPWLLLIPRRPGTRELVDLDSADQQQLLEEINLAASALRQLHSPERLNIASLGNLVPQLHVHVIARSRNDAAWPHPVWGRGTSVPYTPEVLQVHLEELRRLLAG